MSEIALPWALTWSLIFSPCLNDLPEKCTESELFAVFLTMSE